MPKVLGTAGISIADNYDVEGSIVGIDELDAKEVKTVHEMGGQIFSERLRVSIINFAAAPAQSTTFSSSQTIGLDAPHRILGFELMGNFGSRLTSAALMVRNPNTGREIPIWTWNTTPDDEVTIIWDNDGAGAGAITNYRSVKTFTPQLLCRMGTLKDMPTLVLRGVTPAFGAGNLTLDGLLTLYRATTGFAGESSHGLVVPSW